MVLPRSFASSNAGSGEYKFNVGMEGHELEVAEGESVHILRSRMLESGEVHLKT